MKLLITALFVLLCLLQYRLWFGFNGISDYYQHRSDVSRHSEGNQQLVKRNQLLAEDVKDLKAGLEAIEELARNELGMIANDETYFRIISDSEQNN